VALRGEDLKNMGLKPGPIFRDIFRAVLSAKLNGRLITQKDEIQFVRRYLRTGDRIK
jgi:tRNA nucleotidyltransferase (CCA-adding enzyme)